MIKAILIGLFIPFAYFGIYVGTIELAQSGLFETEYYMHQFRIIHLVRDVGNGELWHSTISRREYVKYNKKWWQLYKIEPLPDEWMFDSDETKKIWEKINEN